MNAQYNLNQEILMAFWHYFSNMSDNSSGNRKISNSPQMLIHPFTASMRGNKDKKDSSTLKIHCIFELLRKDSNPQNY